MNRNKFSWRRLDNTAKIFSLESKNNSNVFRFSVLLKKKVKLDRLYMALKRALDDYPSFKVKFSTGLFWNYFDYNSKEPIINEETGIPCEYINFVKNNNYLFKVSYYKNKINLDVFHALTDGTGAINFLKTLIYHYLDSKYYLTPCNNNTVDKDQNLKHYDKKYKMSYDFKPAYQIPGKVNNKINNTYHYVVSVKEIKEICKILNVTITEFITAVYIYAMYLTIYNKKTNKEINVTVPIDLRKHYNEQTLTNFFTYMNITSNLTEKENITFDSILKHVHNEFKEKLTNKKIKEYLSRDVNLGMNLSIRLVPLFIKKAFIKYMGKMVTKSSTTTLSNVGAINIKEKYKKHIDNILVMVKPSRVQKIKCTICSYSDKLNISLNANINDNEFEKTFLKILRKNIKNIEVISNKVINE